jgi:hypothetical protein
MLVSADDGEKMIEGTEEGRCARLAVDSGDIAVNGAERRRFDDKGGMRAPRDDGHETADSVSDAIAATKVFRAAGPRDRLHCRSCVFGLLGAGDDDGDGDDNTLRLDEAAWQDRPQG